MVEFVVIGMLLVVFVLSLSKLIICFRVVPLSDEFIKKNHRKWWLKYFL